MEMFNLLLSNRRLQSELDIIFKHFFRFWYKEAVENCNLGKIVPPTAHGPIESSREFTRQMRQALLPNVAKNRPKQSC
jgi:hypothetical protein